MGWSCSQLPRLKERIVLLVFLPGIYHPNGSKISAIDDSLPLGFSHEKTGTPDGAIAL